uniref:IF rod domain-containing protein n=1 Tax=Bursaphelenchus xylophilus TaxID=6326 RepID=A0A1I7SFG3_BURXY
MGTGASTTRVQRISADSNSAQHKKAPSALNHARRPSLGAINDRPRRNGLDAKVNEDELEQENKIQNVIMEHKRHEVEEFVEGLKREITTLELKNRELREEVSWLKEQLGGAPELPSAFSTAKIKPNGISGDLKAMYVELLDKYDELKKETNSIKNTSQKQISELQSELKEQTERYQTKVKFEQEIRERMEEVIREHLGEDYLFGVRSSVARDSSASVSSNSSIELKPLCRNFLPKGGRMSTPLTDSDETLNGRQLESYVTDKPLPPIAPRNSLNGFGPANGLDLSRPNDSPLPNERPSTSSALEQRSRRTRRDTLEELTVSENDLKSSNAMFRRPTESRQRRLKSRERRYNESQRNAQAARGESMEIEVESITSNENFADAEDVDEILNVSIPSLASIRHSGDSVTPVERFTRLSTSAKSRDSGFLGDTVGERTAVR